ncbi:nitroreductase family protein [Sinomicrobium soli]|uniref:nitroreductase family protein n=1 Tax=Sinomicrobium sp. N-1-3-6 TaxID=2219864 RepID=UPI000DCEA561|nr:nitroreductase family protein [Sinomicrobium sp. N-1-3-6]RAV29404.1 nitroreductase [Sinomicrobium sp. N-1-3-6]
MKKRIKKVVLWVEHKGLKIISINPWFSSFYYFLFSSAFRREHHAVIKGRIQYYNQNIWGNDVNYLLTRNIHRIEKGLIMKQRKPVFALEYIEETVHAYEIAVRSYSNEQVREFKWYTDVLSTYFESVDHSNTVINLERKKFENCRIGFKDELKSAPYKRNFDLRQVSYDQMYNLAILRRSVRWYEERKVPRELIDKAIKIAGLSPSACNRQPFEFRVYDKPELVREIADITWGTKGFSHNFPALIVLVGKLEAYFDERDRHVIYIDASLAAMSFMFALETQGLSSCPINWPDVKEFESKMSNLLKLVPHERPVMLISLGYPDKDAMVPFSEKKGLSVLRTYNKIN